MAALACGLHLVLLICALSTSAKEQTAKENNDHLDDRVPISALVENPALEENYDQFQDAPILSAKAENRDVEEEEYQPEGTALVRTCGENEATCRRDDSERVPCSHLPGGLRRLTFGVHLAKLTLKPLDHIAPDGYALPIVRLTCRKHMTWGNPHNSVVYLRPEEIDYIRDINTVDLQSTSEVFRTSYDVKDSFNESITVEGEYKIVAGSLSAGLKDMTQQIRQKERRITEVSAVTAALEIHFKDDGLRLDERAQEYLDMLPDDITEDREGYAEFVDLFGTHYFIVGKLGGILKSTTTTEVNKVADISEFDISGETKIEFDKMLRHSGGVGFLKMKLTSNFSTATETKIRFYGGNTNLLEKEGIKKWQPTVYDEPWVYGGNFREVYHLLDKNDKKREALKIAVESRLNEDFKTHLVQTFNEVLTVYQKLSISVTALTKLKVDLDKEVNRKLPLISELSRIEQELKSIVNPPNWWKDVMLCLEAWGVEIRANGRGHTWPRTIKQRCASTDSFTQKFWFPLYTADNYVNALGWMIRTNGSFDSYFKQVELCARHKRWDERSRSWTECQKEHHEIFVAETCAPVDRWNGPILYSLRLKHNSCR